MKQTPDDRRKAKAQRKRAERKAEKRERIAKAKERDAEEARERKIETDNWHRATFGVTFDELMAATGRRVVGRRVVRI